MNDSIFNTDPQGRWHVPVLDVGHWRMGVYRPEHSSADAITVLEKHTCPELFICQGGRMGLLVGSGAAETVLEMEPGQAILVTDYHNGFSLDARGHFLVVERTSFSTEYIDRKSLAVVERRTVG
ncbi:MAG: hypothetical protein KBA61_08490 [Spirochaetes bacterium]|nr:hypothetical protein [Spirochaetota bacterium]